LAVWAIPRREGEPERGVDAVTLENLDQLAQVDYLLALIAYVESVQLFGFTLAFRDGPAASAAFSRTAIRAKTPVS
jgi:hypothetical protein